MFFVNLWKIQICGGKKELNMIVREAWDRKNKKNSPVTRLGYLVWRPCGRLVLVVGENEERQCTELRVLKGRVELVACRLKVFI